MKTLDNKTAKQLLVKLLLDHKEFGLLHPESKNIDFKNHSDLHYTDVQFWTISDLETNQLITWLCNIEIK